MKQSPHDLAAPLGAAKETSYIVRRTTADDIVWARAHGWKLGAHWLAVEARLSPAEREAAEQRYREGRSPNHETERRASAMMAAVDLAVDAMPTFAPLPRAEPLKAAHVYAAEAVDALRSELAEVKAMLEEATRPEPFADAIPGDVLHDEAPLVEISLGTGKKPS